VVPLVLLSLLFAMNALGQTDVTAPTFVSVELEPVLIDTRLSDQFITVTVHMTDDLSGVSFMTVAFETLNGQHNITPVFSPVSGNDQNGIWVATMRVPQFSSFGRWILGFAASGDKVGNECRLQSPSVVPPPCFRSSTDVYFVNVVDEPTPTPTPTMTPTPTVTPYPTYTQYPTYTPYPTYTAYPTNTPYPTYTPYPTLNAECHCNFLPKIISHRRPHPLAEKG
jgi:hypothetical protein